MSIVSYDQTGYVGSSMSENALLAYEAGEKPKSKWTKKAMLAEIGEFCETLGLAIPAEIATMKKDDLFGKFFKWSSWHHTSKFANETDFYDLDGEKVVEVFLAHRDVGELEKIAENGNWTVRRRIAEQGHALDKLAGDEDEFVRDAVAEAAGKAGRKDLLDKLVDDKNSYVRATVAKQASIFERNDLLDKLADDEKMLVRAAVARQDHALDALADDPTYCVRRAVAEAAAEAGREDLLDKLVDDENMFVRADVAEAAGKAGRGDLLERLADDRSYIVREAAVETAVEIGRADLLDLGKMAGDESWTVRQAVAVAAGKVECDSILDRLAADGDWHVRQAVAEAAGKAGRDNLMDKMANDKNWYVREAVKTGRKARRAEMEGV